MSYHREPRARLKAPPSSVALKVRIRCLPTTARRDDTTTAEIEKINDCTNNGTAAVAAADTVQQQHYRGRASWFWCDCNISRTPHIKQNYHVQQRGRRRIATACNSNVQQQRLRHQNQLLGAVFRRGQSIRHRRFLPLTGCLSGKMRVSSISCFTSAYPANECHSGVSPVVLRRGRAWRGGAARTWAHKMQQHFTSDDANYFPV